MSCYKTLLEENEALRAALRRAQHDIDRLRETFAEQPDWVDAQTVLRELATLDLAPLPH